MILDNNFAGCMSVATGVNWTTANEHCGTQSDSLVDILDVQNYFSYFRGLKPIWSPVKGQFTPWIAYRGCFYDQNICPSSTKKHLTTTTFCHVLNGNSAGNCYFKCKSKNYTYGGCANNVHFFFGLKGTICLCMCNNNLMQTLSESPKCNYLCRGSISNGVCGGLNHFSVYESTTVGLPDARFGGFCLTCQSQSHSINTMLFSRDCNANATGYCIMRNGSLSLPPLNSTFDLYWRTCRNHNKYIVGDTSQICHHRENSIWTGLRKYKIDDSTTDDTCYIIEIQNGTANYNKGNCTEHHFFFCKREVGQRNFSSIEYMKSTKNTVTPPLTRKMPFTTRTTSSYIPFRTVTLSVTSLNMSTIYYEGPIISTTTSPPPSHSSKSGESTETLLGASIAGVVVLIMLSVVFFIICLLKRRKLQSKKSKKHKAKSDKVFDNTAYGDLVETNQKEKVSYANTTAENDKPGSISKMDDIYVGKEEEYDHLHTSRQKKMTIQIDDDRYGSATVLEDDSYSTLGQNKTVDSDFDNEYSVNSMPYSKNQLSSVNSPEYDYCYQTN